MEILVRAHSGLRYVVLALLLAAVFVAFSKWQQKDDGSKDIKLYTFAMVSTHIQLLIGLVLYVWSPKVNFSMLKETVYRFYTVEHLTGMLIAIALITIGRVRSRKAVAENKHKTVFLFYVAGLILIFASIPWPFRANLGGGWY